MGCSTFLLCYQFPPPLPLGPDTVITSSRRSSPTKPFSSSCLVEDKVPHSVCHHSTLPRLHVLIPHLSLRWYVFPQQRDSSVSCTAMSTTPTPHNKGDQLS